MTFRGVLFDVGGPLDTEVTAEASIDRQIMARLAAAGIAVSEAQYRAANDAAIASFAPDAYSAIIWTLCGANPALATKVRGGTFEDRVFELRDGIEDVLELLKARGMSLGLAANQPTRIVTELDRAGIGHYFTHREVSGHHGFRKPDVRLFLRACHDLGVAPHECVMVGDRIDNDIVPARVLGMATVLFRTGRHAAQQPRSADEVPGVEVRSVPELRRALTGIIESG